MCGSGMRSPVLLATVCAGVLDPVMELSENRITALVDVFSVL